MKKKNDKSFVHLMYVFTAFFVTVIVGSSIAEVDISTTVAGTIVPDGQVKIVQPLEIGKIQKINVNDGSFVNEGDVLIELESIQAEAEETRVFGLLIDEQLALARFEAMLGYEDGAVFTPPKNAPVDTIESNRRFMDSQLKTYETQIREIESQISERRAALSAFQALIDKYNSQLALSKERVSISQYLYDQQYGNKITLLQNQERIAELQGDLLYTKEKIAEAGAALRALQDTKDRIKITFRQTILDGYTKTQRNIADLTQQHRKANDSTRNRTLLAPVSGVIQELRVHTVGGIVTTADVLMVIVPKEMSLKVDALVPNEDIGFVSVGQKAEIMVSTFDYRRYGTIDGIIVNLSQDAIGRPGSQSGGQQGGPQPGGGTQNGAPSSGGQSGLPVFKASIALSKTQMNIDGRDVSLNPGMGVMVAVLLGKRKLINFVLEPIKGLQRRAFREN